MQQDGPATVAQGATEDGGLTVAQTAMQLSISTDAVRRRLKAGELSGHQRQTKHGPAWCIHPDELPGSRNGPATLELTVAPESHEGSTTLPPESDTPEAGDDQAGPAAGMALMQAEAMAAYTRSILEPLVAALERSENRARDLERENGRLTAELSAGRTARTTLEARTAPEVPAPATDTLAPLWRTWWSWLLGLLALATVSALVVWPK
jgi:hypothetical protein